MDTLKAIQVFIEVAKRQSFTQAADALDLSRAMTSRYVDHLESLFNVRLLQRNTRKVSLTSAGEQALSHCYAILRQQQQLTALSTDMQIQGSIRLTMGQFLFQLYFKEIMTAFSKLYPQVRFDLLITEDIVDIYDQRIDLAFRISQKFAEGLIAYPLKKIVSTLCASPAFLAQVGSIDSPQQLLNLPCIVHQAIGKNGSWTLTHQDRPQNYNLHAVYCCNEVMVLHQLSLAGQGIAMLPIDLVQQDISSQTLVPVLSEYQPPVYELCMLYSSRQYLPKIMQLFIAFTKQYFASDDVDKKYT